MALSTLLAICVMGCALIVLFRNIGERGVQYLSVLCLALAAAAFAVEKGWIPIPARFHPEIVLPGAAGLVGLLLFVKAVDKAFPLLLAFASALQVCVGTGFVRGLHP